MRRIRDLNAIYIALSTNFPSENKSQIRRTSCSMLYSSKEGRRIRKQQEPDPSHVLLYSRKGRRIYYICVVHRQGSNPSHVLLYSRKGSRIYYNCVVHRQGSNPSHVLLYSRKGSRIYYNCVVHRQGSNPSHVLLYSRKGSRIYYNCVVHRQGSTIGHWFTLSIWIAILLTESSITRISSRIAGSPNVWGVFRTLTLALLHSWNVNSRNHKEWRHRDRT
jgi:hypothetical protein